jgi:hypothetical protein
MLDRSKGLADWTKYHLHEIQGYVSGRSSDQAARLTHLDSHYHNRSQKTTTLSSVDYMGKLCSYVVL